MKLEEIYVVCPLHSRPGSPIRATVRPFGGKALLAICPHCIAEGKRLQEEMGVRMVSEPVKIQPAP